MAIKAIINNTEKEIEQIKNSNEQDVDYVYSRIGDTEVEGKPPISIKSIGGNLADYRICGQTSRNLFDENWIDSSIWSEGDWYFENHVLKYSATGDSRAWSYNSSQFKFTLKPGTYVLSAITLKSPEYNSNFAGWVLYDSDNNVLKFKTGSDFISTTVNIMNFTLTDETNLGLCFKTMDGEYEVMLNSGSTPLPYEPYGESVGDRTGNLFDETIYDKNVADSTITYIPIYVGNIDYVTCSTTCPINIDARYIFILSGRVNRGAENATNGVSNGAPRTIQPSNGYVTIAYRKIESNNVRPWEYQTMLNTGSEPLPYEPYGYKVPVTVEGKNLWSAPIEQGGIGNAGNNISSNYRIRSTPISVTPGKTYTISVSSNIVIQKIQGYTDNSTQVIAWVNTYVKTITIPENVITIGISMTKYEDGQEVEIYPSDFKWGQVEEGEAATGYEPYRTPVTTPIYLPKPIKKVGDEAEYIDYSEQKFYRISGANLDITLPALSTIKGTNTLSVGTSIQPSNIYIKDNFDYKKVFTATRAIEDKSPLNYRSIEDSDSTLKNYRIYGQTVDGESVGDLVTSGEHTGEYEVPVTVSNGTDTQIVPIYLLEPIKMVGDETEYIDYAEQKQYIETTDGQEKYIIGLNVDFENKTFARLADAIGLSKGADFDNFSALGGRRRCNVADNGAITAYYGDANYAEDGSNGQVMVYQPAFYYKVEPLKIEAQESGVGYHLRNVNYYISNYQGEGYKLHPAFYNEAGDRVDYILLGAYEGCIYDTSANAYVTDNSQVMNTSEDKFSSIANVKPASGLSQNLTRPNLETICKNRGDGWHSLDIRIASMEQLLMIIEFGTMNTQTGSGSNGIVSITDNSSYNCASLTGSTASLGNASGQAASTISDIGGTQTVETSNGKTAYSFRGDENPWGNIWKFVHGVNIWGNGSMNGGIPYICTDFNFSESKNTGNYVSAGFSIPNNNGNINALGYSENFDWLLIPSEVGVTSTLPVGDVVAVLPNLNAYTTALSGGRWDYNLTAGVFNCALNNYSNLYTRAIGGRLVYIPQIKKQHIYTTDLDVTLPALPQLSDLNTLSVETEIQPSEVYIKGKIKPVYNPYVFGSLPFTFEAKGLLIKKYEFENNSNNTIGTKTANLVPDLDGWIMGKALSSYGDVQENKPTLMISDFIEIEPSTSYKFGAVGKVTNEAGTWHRVVYFDENKANISFVDNNYMNTSFTTPATAKYLRLCTTFWYQPFLVKSSDSYTYVPYGYNIPIVLNNTTYQAYLPEPLEKELICENGNNVSSITFINGETFNPAGGEPSEAFVILGPTNNQYTSYGYITYGKATDKYIFGTTGTNTRLISPGTYTMCLTVHNPPSSNTWQISLLVGTYTNGQSYWKPCRCNSENTVNNVATASYTFTIDDTNETQVSFAMLRFDTFNTDATIKEWYLNTKVDINIIEGTEPVFATKTLINNNDEVIPIATMPQLTTVNGSNTIDVNITPKPTGVRLLLN